MPYDVGAETRAFYDVMLKVSPNRTTPEDWIDVLDRLNELTVAVEARDLARREALGFGSGSPTMCSASQLCTDIAQWRARLDWYLLHAHSAPPGDRAAVLWTVTAPLLLGWHGGPTGQDVMVAPGGYPPGFNFAMPHGADIAWPFILANGVDVFMAWEAERRELLWADIQANAAGLASKLSPWGVPWWVWLGGGLLAWKLLPMLLARPTVVVEAA